MLIALCWGATTSSFLVIALTFNTSCRVQLETKATLEHLVIQDPVVCLASLVPLAPRDHQAPKDHRDILENLALMDFGDLLESKDPKVARESEEIEDLRVLLDFQ